MIRSSVSILALLCAFTTPAFAENWRLAAGTAETREFIDVDSIVRNGNAIRFSRHTRFSSLQSVESVPTYDSLVTVYAGDCGDRSLQRLQITVKRGNQTLATYAGDREVRPAAPGSVAAGILLSICDNNWPDPNQ